MTRKDANARFTHLTFFFPHLFVCNRIRLKLQYEVVFVFGVECNFCSQNLVLQKASVRFSLMKIQKANSLFPQYFRHYFCIITIARFDVKSGLLSKN